MMRFAIIIILIMTAGIVFAGTQFMGDRHEDYGAACIDCHEEENPEEGAWADYEKCLLCHGGWDELAEATKSYGEHNPHKSHLGEPDCTICHKGHEQSTLYCSKCHADLESVMK